MARFISYLLLASWILVLAAIYAIPILSSPDASQLFPIPTAKNESVPDASKFTFHPAPYTAYDLTRDTMIVTAALLWFFAAALMIKNRARIVRLIIDGTGRTITSVFRRSDGGA